MTAAIQPFQLALHCHPPLAMAAIPAALDRVFFNCLSSLRQRNFLPHLILIFIIPHLIPLNSTQTLRHLLSHLCGKADGEFELRASCRSRESTRESLRNWWTVGGRCRFRNQLLPNHLPPPIHPHCSRMVPRPYQCAAGAWRPSESVLETWSNQIARRSRQTRR